MNGSVNLPVIGRVDKKGLIIGATLLFAILVVPKVSDFTVPFLTKIRDMIGGRQ